MPRATTSVKETFKKELKTLPKTDKEEAGWVELKKLTYGQILERRDMATKMSINMPRSGNRDQDMQALMDIAQSRVAEYEFKHSIVKHNLEDENGNLLDFGIPGTVERLDPAVGAEIQDLIEDLNDFESDLTGKG